MDVCRSIFQYDFHFSVATDASILRCCGHRYLNFAVLLPPMPSFCCVTATDASILRCSCPRLVVTPVAVHGRRISRQASGKHSLSPVPPTIYHSGMLCRKQAVSIRPVPQASQNNSIRSLSLRDLALLSRHRATFRGHCFSARSLFREPLFREPLFAVGPPGVRPLFPRATFRGPCFSARSRLQILIHDYEFPVLRASLPR